MAARTMEATTGEALDARRQSQKSGVSEVTKEEVAQMDVLVEE